METAALNWNVLIIGGGVLLSAIAIIVAIVIKPIINLNGTLIKLALTLENVEMSNNESHKDIADRLALHSKILEDHTTRIRSAEDDLLIIKRK